MKSIMLYMCYCVWPGHNKPTPAPVTQFAECPVREWEVTGSIPGRDIPKSFKMVLAAPRLALRLTG